MLKGPSEGGGEKIETRTPTRGQAVSSDVAFPLPQGGHGGASQGAEARWGGP